MSAGEQDKINTCLKLAQELSAEARKELVFKIGALEETSAAGSSSSSAASAASSSLTTGEADEFSWDSLQSEWSTDLTSDTPQWGDNLAADSTFSAEMGEHEEGGEEASLEPQDKAEAEVPQGEEGEERLFSGLVNLSQYTTDPDYSPPEGADASRPAPSRWVDRGAVQMRVLQKDLEEGAKGHRLIARTQATNNLLMNLRLAPLVKVSRVDDLKIRIIARDENNAVTQYLIKLRAATQSDLFDLLTKYTK